MRSEHRIRPSSSRGFRAEVSSTCKTVSAIWPEALLALLLAAGHTRVQALDADSCFSDPRVKELIEESKETDECFASDQSRCWGLVRKMNIKEQRELSAQRLIPFDRSKDALFDQAVGLVTAELTAGDDRRSGPGKAKGTGQRISRCHVLTSAHLFYKATNEQVTLVDLPSLNESDHFDIRFHFGQTCDGGVARSYARANIWFRMTREGSDFSCDLRDNKGTCVQRYFNGKSDIVILKLKDYQRSDHHFFRVRTSPVSIPEQGSRVSCWGFPGYNNQIKLPKSLSDQMLWRQSDAKIFPGNYDRGILTNAVAYPGMSGGGCFLSSAPDELIGIYASKNSLTGIPAVIASAETADERSLNFLSPLDHLAARYRAATGKRIEDLDKECD